MNFFSIPLNNFPQRFEISLAGTVYNLTCKWNDANEGGWVFDINDGITDTPIAAYLPLIVGANILDGLEYLGINGELYAYTDGDELMPPTLDNLGTESNIYFVTEATENE